MTSALDIITSAMRKSGILTKSETPDGDEGADGLEMLNDLIDSWSTESLLIVSRTLVTHTLTGGDGEYTIGSGGDINTSRPTYISAAYTSQATLDYHLDIIDDERYARIVQKTTGSDIPLFLNYTNGYPLGTIKLWPVPASAYTLNLLTEKPITTLASLATTVDFAPGWKRALIYNLAEELAPEYGQPVSADIARIAKQSKTAIKRAITKNRTMDVPGKIYNRHSIFSGWET